MTYVHIAVSNLKGRLPLVVASFSLRQKIKKGGINDSSLFFVSLLINAEPGAS
jgi:hypothetical protein